MEVKIVDRVHNLTAKRALVTPKRHVSLTDLRQQYRTSQGVRDQLKTIAQLAEKTGVLVIETFKSDIETAHAFAQAVKGILNRKEQP